jgi:hypothetical protein
MFRRWPTSVFGLNPETEVEMGVFEFAIFKHYLNLRAIASIGGVARKSECV